MARVRKVTKLLLVEDNAMGRKMLVRRLTRKGFEVVVAADGAEAISLVTRERPDLVIMDLSLPVMDGWEATRRLKGQAETRDIPVIALTAHAMAGDRDSALEAGCDDYEAKPVEFKRLLDKIDRLLGAG